MWTEMVTAKHCFCSALDGVCSIVKDFMLSLFSNTLFLVSQVMKWHYPNLLESWFIILPLCMNKKNLWELTAKWTWSLYGFIFIKLEKRDMGHMILGGGLPCYAGTNTESETGRAGLSEMLVWSHCGSTPAIGYKQEGGPLEAMVSTSQSANQAGLVAWAAIQTQRYGNGNCPWFAPNVKGIHL